MFDFHEIENDDCLCTACITSALNELVEEGIVEIAGMNEDGEMIFALKTF